MTNTDNQFEYDVALSFAGEDRAIVEQFANLLRANNIKVFYDEQEAADLWGKDLVPHLAEIYGKKARYCVMFISQYYHLKKWTNLERMHAQARAFRDPNEYILPIRLDDTEVPGLAETIGYRDIRQHSLESISNTLKQKLAKAKGQAADNLLPSQNVQSAHQHQPDAAFDIPMPKRKKTFTQLDKDRFARESFAYIKQYFQQALQKLEAHDTDIQTDFNDISSIEFISKVYVHGNIACQCQIWLGDGLFPNSICYNEGRQLSGQRNSLNDYLSVEENGEELRLRTGIMSMGMIKIDDPFATKEKAAEYLWRRLTYRLESR